MSDLRSRLVGQVSMLLLVAGAAGAATIEPMTDGTLTDLARLIVVGVMEQRSNVELPRPETEWTVSIERVLKGRFDSGRLVLRVPGGTAPNGLIRFVPGAPPLASGQRAILFLVPAGGGAYHLVDTFQGAFLGVNGRDRAFAFRDMPTADSVRVIGHVGQRGPMRQFDRFGDWIEDRASGLIRPVDYLLTPSRSELKAITQQFQLWEYDTNLYMRWAVFDVGGSVPWRMHETPIPGLAGGGAGEVTRALAAWNDEPTTAVSLFYAGTGSGTGGTDNWDGVNMVLWNDPNDEIPGPFMCGQGGTIAHANVWLEPRVVDTFNGLSFRRIVGGDVVFNDGVECRKGGSARKFSAWIERTAGHEIGHTLGLLHSSENRYERNTTLLNAIMYAYISYDGRNATLNKDDIAGLQTLYRPGGVPGGGGGGGGSKPPASGCPAGTAPNTLCLLKGRFHVTGTWSNQFDGSSGTAMPVVNSDLSGFFYFTDPGNIELIVKILDFGSEIKVFYSQLTNLKFTLNVTDTSTGRTKSYANTPGDCGAIDQNFSNALTSSSSSSLSSITAAASSGTCVADSRTLCTLNNRFAITVDWRNQFNGVSGTGSPKKLTNLTGAFSFDDPANLEILIKTLEFPDKILVIYGSLSNFEYTLRVTDTTSGKVKEYKNAAGNFCGGLDENAF